MSNLINMENKYNKYFLIELFSEYQFLLSIKKNSIYFYLKLNCDTAYLINSLNNLNAILMIG